MQMPIILLSGHARAGKDTAGEILSETLGGQTLALADPIKRFCHLGFKMVRDQLWGALKEAPMTLKVPDPTVLADAFADATVGGHHVWGFNEEELVERIAAWAGELPEKTTPRHIMQTFGTECIRSMDPHFWINYGLEISQGLLHGDLIYDAFDGPIVNDGDQAPENVVVITDGRFRSEILAVKDISGMCIRIERPATATALDPAAALHKSEIEQDHIPAWWFDHVLSNTGTLPEFATKLGTLAARLSGA